jgi:CDP-diacylglycerol--glycerol-3-phosphate 3-phosphatidyltransferase
VVAIALYVLPLSGPLAVVREAVMAAAVVVTVVTGIDYGVRAVRLHRRPPPAGAGAVP